RRARPARGAGWRRTGAPRTPCTAATTPAHPAATGCRARCRWLRPTGRRARRRRRGGCSCCGTRPRTRAGRRARLGGCSSRAAVLRAGCGPAGRVRPARSWGGPVLLQHVPAVAVLHHEVAQGGYLVAATAGGHGHLVAEGTQHLPAAPRGNVVAVGGGEAAHRAAQVEAGPVVHAVPGGAAGGFGHGAALALRLDAVVHAGAQQGPAGGQHVVVVLGPHLGRERFTLERHRGAHGALAGRVCG